MESYIKKNNTSIMQKVGIDNKKKYNWAYHPLIENMWKNTISTTQKSKKLETSVKTSASANTKVSMRDVNRWAIYWICGSMDKMVQLVMCEGKVHNLYELPGQ